MNVQNAYKREARYDGYHMDLSKVYYSKIITEVLSGCPKGVLLDVGCYDGSLGEVFVKKGYSVYGVEAHDEASEKARGKGIDVIKDDIEKGLPWQDNFFDCVVAAEIIEHIYDTDKLLDDMKRVLSKNGLLVVSIPNTACFTNRIKLLFNRYPRYCEYQAGTAGGHIRVYTLEAIRSQLVEHGFNIVNIRGANFPLPMENPHIPDIIKKTAVFFGDYMPGLSGQIIVSARNEK